MIDRIYYVIYNRDFEADRGKKRELYSHCKEFESVKTAEQFATDKVSEGAILIVSPCSEDKKRIKFPKLPITIALNFPEKYSHYGWGGENSTGYWDTWEVFRCKKGELEKILNKVTEEAPKRIIWGNELKLFKL